MRPGDIVVFAGSLPENVSVQDYVELILAVKNTGGVGGGGQRFCCRWRTTAGFLPWLIKPNIHELRHIVKVMGTTIDDVADAARVLRDSGVENVVVSLGGNGLVCVSGDRMIRAAVPQVEVKSTVGAGDSALAGFIVGFVKEYELPECVRLAAACGTACAMRDGTLLATKGNGGRSAGSDRSPGIGGAAGYRSR